jgi:hypothetical protein
MKKAMEKIQFATRTMMKGRWRSVKPNVGIYRRGLTHPAMTIRQST